MKQMKLTVKERKYLAQGFERAAEALEANGWCQQAYTRGSARCIVGGIRDVFGVGTESTYLALRVLRAWLGVDIAVAPDETPQQLYEWNDATDRRKDDVLSSLRECAEELRSGEFGHLYSSSAS